MSLTTISYAQTTAIPDPKFEQALIDLGHDSGVIDGRVLTSNINAITKLTIVNKGISDLTGLEGFTALEELFVNNNNLTSLSLSNNESLTRLDAYDNQLTNIDVSSNTNLEVLFVYRNNLTSIDVSKNVSLFNIGISKNKLTSIDVSKNTGLKYFTIAGNQIVDIDVSNNPALIQIFAENNKLISLNVKNGMNNLMTNMSATNNPKLKCIQVDALVNNRPFGWAKDNIASYNTDCRYSDTYVPDDNFEQTLINLGYDSGVLDDYVPTANIRNVTLLDVRNKAISNMTGVEGFISLETLFASNNQFSSINVSKNLELRNVLLDQSNSLASIDFSNNTKLFSLTLTSRLLENIDLSKNVLLERLLIAQSRLARIDISKNIALTRLIITNSISNNRPDGKLTSLDVSKNLALTYLDLRGTGLTSLNVNNNIALTKLLCNFNYLNSLDLSKNLNLTELKVENNNLNSLNVKNGNNTQITSSNFSLIGNKFLSCVKVDNSDWSEQNWLKRESITRYSNSCEEKIWVGGVNSDWGLINNWKDTSKPTSLDDVLIASGAINYPTINTNTTVKSIVIESDATLIVNASVQGNTTYKRNLNTSNWYLVSNPLIGESIQNIIANNSFATGKNGNLGLGIYDNREALALDRWKYQKSNSGGIANTGKGFAVKLATSGKINFKGFVNSGANGAAISKNATSYNLVGNPYLALVKSQNFLTRNTSSLESETIWVWNQATNNYDTKVTADNFNIAVGQAFFVKSKVANTTITFIPADQTHGTDTFQRGVNEKSELKLNVSNGEVDKYVKIYFIASATKGYDNGYDGELFSGVENKFEVYSELLENNKNKKYQIQSIPSKEEHSIIPIGIKAAAGEKIKFSIEGENISKNIKIYIEDKDKQLFTRIDSTTENYSVNLSKSINGTGRFYMHKSSKEILKEDIVKASNLKINHLGTNTIQIQGIDDLTMVKVYTILGKEVVSKNLNRSNNQFQLPNLASGIYIVKVKTKEKQKTRKIVLK